MAKAGLKVDVAANSITMTPKFNEKASVFGTNEYRQLQEALRYCKELNLSTPTIKVTGIKKNANKQTYEGLNYKFIKDYVSTHGTQQQKEDFNHLIVTDEKMHGIITPVSYGTLKKWFLTTFPEYKEYAKKQQEIAKNGSAEPTKETTSASSNNVIETNFTGTNESKPAS